MEQLKELIIRLDEKVKAIAASNTMQDQKAATFVTKEQLDIHLRSLEQKFLDGLTALDRRLTEKERASQWLQRAIIGALIASTVTSALSLIYGG